MHIYRIAGRGPDVLPLPLPSARTFFAPLGRAVVCLVMALVPLVVFNQLVVPNLVPSGASLIPTFDFVQDGVALAMLGSVAVLFVVLWQRVRPRWHALWLSTKLAYVVALLAMQLALTAGAELALYQSRGGLQLLGPVLKSTTMGPDGQTAFVYASGELECGWDVQVAEPFSPFMRYVSTVRRAACDEPVPNVTFDFDRSIVLRDAEGKPLEPQSSPSLGLRW